MTTLTQQYPYQPVLAMTRRRMTEAEKDLAVKSVKGMRGAVQGVAFASIFVAAVSLNWPNGLFSLIAISVALTVVILMAQYSSRRSRLKKALMDGTVVDLTGVPQRSGSPKGWKIGAVALPYNARVDQHVVEGRPATVACMPGMSLALSVDGAMLPYAVPVTAPASAWDSAQRAAPSMPVEDELPPPPTD